MKLRLTIDGVLYKKIKKPLEALEGIEVLDDCERFPDNPMFDDVCLDVEIKRNYNQNFQQFNKWDITVQLLDDEYKKYTFKTFQKEFKKYIDFLDGLEKIESY